MTQIPVIDLFAGPGGLAEGFSSVTDKKNKRIFKIRLSIEKDENAHKTLLLRSFCRQFPLGALPPEYYDVVEAITVADREKRIEALYNKYQKEAETARKEAWNCELGSEKFPPDVIDKRIQEELRGTKEWVLIGGPPCQAYSMAGRSRVGGIDPEDHRVFLYKEYLRIIANHHPAVFVMENVKGLLSAQVNGEKVFDWIKRDLQDPSTVFPETDASKYRIYSLSTPFSGRNLSGNPVYKDDRDYLIKSEDFGVPQCRHRVILLGIREDLEATPETLKQPEKQQTIAEIIGSLPALRSGLSKKYVGFEMVEKDGRKKKRRLYEKVDNSDKNWHAIFIQHAKELSGWNDVAGSNEKMQGKRKLLNCGAEFVACNKTIDPSSPLATWYTDPRLGGVPNHETRTHLQQDLKRYLYSAKFAEEHKNFPRMHDYEKHNKELLPDHESATSGKFADRFRVQMPNRPATTVTSHISKDGHYFIHYDWKQCRSLTVREAARIQTFPDNYVFCGSRTAQYHQVGNAVPPFLAYQIAEIVKNI
jgi:DNA (cytosine-5)-methyltransferase 1